jgi:hypothetical protein
MHRVLHHSVVRPAVSQHPMLMMLAAAADAPPTTLKQCSGGSALVQQTAIKVAYYAMTSRLPPSPCKNLQQTNVHHIPSRSRARDKKQQSLADKRQLPATEHDSTNQCRAMHCSAAPMQTRLMTACSTANNKLPCSQQQPPLKAPWHPCRLAAVATLSTHTQCTRLALSACAGCG